MVTYGYKSWTIKKAECQGNDAFKLWCWRRLLRVPWTAGRSNQSILKEINPEYSLEGLMLKLKLQYFGHLMRWALSLEKSWMLGKIEGRRRREWQRSRWLDGVTNAMDMNLGKLREMVRDREAWHVRHDWVTEQWRQQYRWFSSLCFCTLLSLACLSHQCSCALCGWSLNFQRNPLNPLKI